MNRKIIKNALIMATMVLFVPMAAAQVTIGGVADPRATLDVLAAETNPIGIIAPHVTRADLQITMAADNVRTHRAAQTGAIIFVSSVAGENTHASTANVTAVGYHWFDGTLWQPFGGAAAVAAPNVIRRDFSTTAGHPTVAELSADHTILINTGSWGGTNLVIPDLAADRVGKTLTFVHRGSVAAQFSLTLLTQYTLAPAPSSSFSSTITSLRGRTIVWVGDAWVETNM